MTIFIRTEQAQQMADAQPGQQMVKPCAHTAAWLEVQLLDTDGDPVPGERFKVRLPDQSIQLGRLDGEGKVRFEGIVAGTAKISFPGIDAKEWRPL